METVDVDEVLATGRRGRGWRQALPPLSSARETLAYLEREGGGDAHVREKGAGDANAVLVF